VVTFIYARFARVLVLDLGSAGCPVAVRQPRVRDREADATDPDRIRFSPSILPPYLRRSKSIETLLPILYLKGISTGDFSEALAALLGKDAAGLSASAIGRLKDGWLDEHTAWQKRDLSAKRYVYIWADGIHLQPRLEDEKQCILVLIGATPEGRKELVGFTDGARESAHDWRDLLLDLKPGGLDAPPRLVIADGAHGFWKAAGEVWPRTREQCWVHKTANVLAKLPKSQQPKASVAGDLDGRNQGRRRAGVRHRGELRAKIRDGGRLPKAGSRRTAGFLRLPSRALETLADHQTLLKAPSPLCATARSDRRAVCRTGPRSRWSSNYLRARRKAGVVWMATTSCQNSFLV
jgi:hypothetical protein